jgi:hypothetical protein
MLSEQDGSISVVGTLAVLLLNATVDNLDYARKVGPAVIIDISVLLQGTLSIPLENLISLHLLEAVVYFIAIFVLLKDGI